MPDPKPRAFCIDCGSNGGKMPRPAPNPGPRCASHWRDEVKRRKQVAAERRNVNTYGLGEGDYERLYAFQQGHCAICRVATGKARRLAVDHRHDTGEVRGLLCKTCNRIVGFARDDPAWFLRAAGYLRTPPAVLLGLRAVHADNRQEAIPPPGDAGRLQPWPWSNDTDAGRALNGE